MENYRHKSENSLNHSLVRSIWKTVFRTYFIAFVFLALCLFHSNFVSGQCNSCDYVVGATGDPAPAIPNNATNILVCITANRTIPINFNNAQQVTVCINEGVTVTSAFNNLSNLQELNNYGDFIAINYNGNWTFNNFGTMSLNFNNLNNNKTINNFGTINRTGGFVINGNLNSSGTFIVSGNLSNNGGGTYISSGSTIVGGNLTNNGLIDAPAGNFSINENLTNNGSGILNIGQGTVSGNVTNNGIINIFDRIEINGNVTLNGGGRFVAANVENPSYVIVEGSFSGSGCFDGTINTLYFNLFDQVNPCTIGDVFAGGNDGCLEIIEFTETTSTGESRINRIYVFRCSTDWSVPNNFETEEIIDAADVVLVGGGGGGGRGSQAGGGGGGQLVETSLLFTPGFTIPIIVGRGGEGTPNNGNNRGNNGNPSRVLSAIAVGGGGGGSNNQSQGGVGASGGGSHAPGNNGNNAGGNSSNATTGNNGGGGFRNGNGNQAGGGGGGAGGPGSSGGGTGNNTAGGNGGPGASQSIIPEFNVIPIFAAGGGATSTGSPGVGGSNIGGNGRSGNNQDGGNGVTNTGSGGGAGTRRGGNGADGIVIIRQTFRILPVQLQFFEAELLSSKRIAQISLRIENVNALEDSKFVLERAFNELNKWEFVSALKVDQRKEKLRVFDERLPLSQGNVYYRVKREDLNGLVAVSELRMVKVNGFESKDIWRVYPNPIGNQELTIELLNREGYRGEAIDMNIVSPSGSIERFQVYDAVQLNGILNQYFLNNAKGLFILNLSWGQSNQTLKLVKNR